jgi:hypothetical protein
MSEYKTYLKVLIKKYYGKEDLQGYGALRLPQRQPFLLCWRV